MHKHDLINSSCVALLFAGLLSGCTAEDSLPVDTPEAILAPRLHVGATETRSIVNGVATTPGDSRINTVKLFVAKAKDDSNQDDGHTPYPGIGSGNTAGLSTFTYTAGQSGGGDEWKGSPEVKLSNRTARIFAFSPADASFTASTANDAHTINVTVPADQTFNGSNNWECSTADYLYGSASNQVGVATNITASNQENGGGTPAYQPEISMQHALSLLVFTLQKESGLSVDNTYDYVQKITLTATGTLFPVTTSENGGTMSVKDGTLSLGGTNSTLTFTPKTATAVLCGPSGSPKTVAYGLVAPLTAAPTKLTVTVFLGKSDNSAENLRELAVDLAPKQWLKGNRYAINLTLSDRAITVSTDSSITGWTDGWSDGDTQGNGNLSPDGF